MVGGDGVDVAVYGKRVSPAFSLDGLANDGALDENDLIGADIEGIEAAAADGRADGDDHRRRPGQPAARRRAARR